MKSSDMEARVTKLCQDLDGPLLDAIWAEVEKYPDPPNMDDRLRLVATLRREKFLRDMQPIVDNVRKMPDWKRQALGPVPHAPAFPPDVSG